MKRVRQVVQKALEEDIGSGDVTTQATVSREATAEARIVAKERGIVAGISVASMAFSLISRDVQLAPGGQDGWCVAPGDVILEVSGSAGDILTAERVALNFLQRLSGIATQTARFVEAVAGTGAKILDTRKTTPGMRFLEKYAVTVGGGYNHRMGLYDMVLIKENHIKAGGGISAAIQKVRAQGLELLVEVEASDLEQVGQAVEAGADRIMLDNMTPSQMQQAVDLVRPPGASGRRPTLEASGNIQLENVRQVAMTGVDFISIGALTHSAPALDMSLLITELIAPQGSEWA